MGENQNSFSKSISLHLVNYPYKKKYIEKSVEKGKTHLSISYTFKLFFLWFLLSLFILKSEREKNEWKSWREN